MNSFVVSKDDVKNFSKGICVNHQEGLLLSYAVPEEIARRIVPPHFELAAPVVNAYICQIKEPSFGSPFMESCIWFPVRYQDSIRGNYFLSLMLQGPGEECGKIVGRDCCGLPKKSTELIEVRRTGNIATAKVVRHGVTLMDVKATLDGAYNDPSAEMMLGAHQAGDIFTSKNLFHKVDLEPTKTGVTFMNARLMYTDYQNTCEHWDKGSLEIKMTSSPDDPYGELEVLRPLGAVWYKYGDCIRTDAGLLAQLDTDAVMPYLMTGLYDRSMMGEKSIFLNL